MLSNLYLTIKKSLPVISWHGLIRRGHILPYFTFYLCALLKVNANS